MNNTLDTVRTKALLVSVTVETPGQTKEDKEITREVHDKHHASDDAGRYTKNLWPEPVLKPWKTASGRVASYLRRPPPVGVTVPFAAGLYIMPSAIYFSASAQAGAYIRAAMSVADSIASKFDDWIEQAKASRNGMFNPRDYPKSKEEFRNQFGIDMRYFPIPSGSHFMLDMIDEEVQSMAAATDQKVEAALKEGQRALLRQMIPPLQHMAQTLKDEKAKFKNSLVNNIGEMVELVPKYNLLGDPMLQKFADEMRDTLLVNPDSLRENRAFRSDVQKRADELCKKLQAYNIH